MSEQRKPTTLIDVYEAAGAKVSQDRKSVELNGTLHLKPFDIVLRVYPNQVQTEVNREPRITFDVLLDEEFVVAERTFYQHEETLTIPVSQIRILKS